MQNIPSERWFCGQTDMTGNNTYSTQKATSFLIHLTASSAVGWKTTFPERLV